VVKPLVALGLLLAVVIGCSSFGPRGSQQPSAIPAAAGTPSAQPTIDLPTLSKTPATTPSPAAQPTENAALPFPLCDSLHELEAPPDWYRDDIYAYVNPDASDFYGWARSQPGFQELWIDRDRHNGWISLAFNEDASERQADVVAKWPERAVVVVPVAYNASAEREVARTIIQKLVGAGIGNVGGGFYEQYGVIHIDMPYLEQQWLDVLHENFADESLCVEGQDPALKPPEGPQPTGGDGWRLLADQDLTGEAYRTGIAYDAASYSKLWSEVGLEGQKPVVDFESEVVIWFGAVHGSSCPRLRLDDVLVDLDRAFVYGDIVDLDAGVCTADALPHAYVVALSRDRLPHSPFTIQLDAEDPPPGAIGERTVVDADLSGPGSTTDASHIHQPGPH
jgi:hypothetical protein